MLQFLEDKSFELYLVMYTCGVSTCTYFYVWGMYQEIAKYMYDRYETLYSTIITYANLQLY